MSVILLSVVAANAALIRRISVERLLNVSATALALATIPVLLFESQGIVGALTAGAARWAWLFRPFDLHHSLTSIIFSLGVMLSIYRVITGPPWIKAAFAAALVAQIAIILASSGRTGLLACSASLLLVFVTRMRRAPPIVWWGLLIAGAGSLWFYREVFGFLSTMLELQSEYRGFGSGATGRTEIWAEGFKLILADPVRLLFGSGLRTAGVEEIGFNPENSYIAIILELGGIMALWFVVALFATIARLHYHATDPDKDARLILYGLLPIIQFAVIVGIFNRQLLSVGNPASLIFLMVFPAAWVYVSGPKPVPAVVAAPRIEQATESAAQRRRRRVAEDDRSTAPSRGSAPSSRAMLRRLRATGSTATLS